MSGETVLDSFRHIEVTVEVAGQVERQAFSPEPNQSFEYLWDRTDGFGAACSEHRPYTARIDYVCGGVFR